MIQSNKIVLIPALNNENWFQMKIAIRIKTLKPYPNKHSLFNFLWF